MAPRPAMRSSTRRHVGPRGAHLRPDGADRDGRHALHRQHDLHLDRIGAMLVVAARCRLALVLPALLGKLGDRVDRAASRCSAGSGRGDRERASGASCSAASCAGRRRRVCWPAARSPAGPARADMHTQLPSFTDLPQLARHREDVRQDPDGVPRRADAGARSWSRPTTCARPRCRRRSASWSSGALASGRCRAPLDVEVNPTGRSRGRPPARRRRQRRGRGAALQTLRDDLVPATVGACRRREAVVTGDTAGTTTSTGRSRSRRRSCSRSCSRSGSCCCWSRSAGS